MKGRKTAVLPGILMAAEALVDDCELGAEVRRYLIRAGYLKINEDGNYEACKS
jgi:hypothetical protein